MQFARFRLRAPRPCDLLLLAILCVNFVYIVFNISAFYRTEVYDPSMLMAENMTVRRENIDVGHKGSRERSGPAEQPYLCPETPPELIGRLACDCEPATKQHLITYHPQIELGGRLRPQNCTARERTAIIIPFRDRHDHLHALLRMLLPVLWRQQVDATLFVVEQTEPALFNRPALLNIGYLEALKVATFDCLIFHDVDLIPLNDHNLYRCLHQPHHLAVSIQFNKWIPSSAMPDDYVDGVIAFTRLQYKFINGNSNLYFGGNTNDLYQRMTNKHLTIVRGNKGVATYYMLSHERQEALSEREEITKSAIKRQDVEGLNTSKYKVVDITSERLYTWIKVSLNMTRVFRTAPAYTLQDIKTALVQNKKA